jgi:hypothetical protein
VIHCVRGCVCGKMTDDDVKHQKHVSGVEGVGKVHEVFGCVDAHDCFPNSHDTHNPTLCCLPSGGYWRNPDSLKSHTLDVVEFSASPFHVPPQ